MLHDLLAKKLTFIMYIIQKIQPIVYFVCSCCLIKKKYIIMGNRDRYTFPRVFFFLNKEDLRNNSNNVSSIVLEELMRYTLREVLTFIIQIEKNLKSRGFWVQILGVKFCENE